VSPLSREIQPGGEAIAASGGDRSPKWYATREPLVLMVLSLLAVVSFLAVTALSGIYHRQQAALGERWYRRGQVDLAAGQAESAVTAFRSALRYSRDDFSYQLGLAQALAAMHRQGEARAYLLSLWEREPEDGTVSLELGRIFAEEGALESALRYYHNAIYAAWPDHPDERRRVARLELIDFLLRENAKTQAQSELIALAANLPENSPLHLKAGGLFVEVQDYEHALQQYRQALKMDSRNPTALAGAGRAAFELGRYSEAEPYLGGAVAENATDSESAQLRQTASLVLQMDPFRRQVSAAKRTRMVIEAFAIAGVRLQSCSAGTEPRTPTAADPEAAGMAALRSRWDALKPRISVRGLTESPDLVEAAMDLVFTIERETNQRETHERETQERQSNGQSNEGAASANCGPPTETDQALFLIAKLHGGN
jgi:tetratricopeptide (TPR) repeat protein